MSEPSPESILEALRAVLKQEFELAAESVTLEAHLIDDLELDSVDAVEFAVVVEERFGVSLEAEEIQSLGTIGSVVEALAARLGEIPGPGP